MLFPRRQVVIGARCVAVSRAVFSTTSWSCSSRFGKVVDVGENMVRSRLGLVGVVASSSARSATSSDPDTCAMATAPDGLWCALWLRTSSPYEERRRSQSGREDASSIATRATPGAPFLTAGRSVASEAWSSPAAVMGEASAEVPSSREMRSLCRAALPAAVALRPPVDAALRTSALAKSSEFLRVGPLGSTSSPRGSSVGSSSRETARELGWRPAMVVMLDATLSRLSLLASRRGVRGAGEPAAGCGGAKTPAVREKRRRRASR